MTVYNFDLDDIQVDEYIHDDDTSDPSPPKYKDTHDARQVSHHSDIIHDQTSQSKYKDDMSLEEMRKMTDTRIKRVYKEMNSKK